MKSIISVILLSTFLTTSAIEAKPLQTSTISNPSYDASTLVRMALRNIPRNYCKQENSMTAFYRESINKDNSCISVNEAILGINKAPCTNFLNDKILIKNARNTKPALQGADAFALKLQGGPNNAMRIDVVKYPFLGVEINELEEKYTFKYDYPVKIDNVDYYVVEFNEMHPDNEMLFRGKLFIEAKSLAIGRIEYNMNVEKRNDAYLSFLRHKPAGMKMNVKSASYVVNYKKYSNNWFFDYSTSEIKFDIKADKKAASTTYTISSQLAVTSMLANGLSIDRKNMLKPTDIVADEIKNYSDETNWDLYNEILLLALGE